MSPSPPSSAARPRFATAHERERMENELCTLWGHINAANYRFLSLLAEYDEKRGWEHGGCRDCAHWLNWACGIVTGAAREKVRVARALKALPRVSAAFAEGRLSYSKVRAITRIATPATEDDLLNIALHGTASHMEKVVRLYRRCERLEEARRAFGAQRSRYLRYRYDDDGSLIIHARLPAEASALFRTAIEVAEDVLFAAERAEETEAASTERTTELEPPADGVSAATRDDVQGASVATPDGGSAVSAETGSRSTIAIRRVDGRLASETRAELDEDTRDVQRADALSYLVERFLERPPRHADATFVADRYQVVIHVDQTLLAGPPPSAAGTASTAATDTSLAPDPRRCELEHARYLAVETARRLACDCSLVGLVANREGEPVSVGRRTRAIPPHIQRALRARDGGCRFPGCDQRRFTQGHHIVHWANGGETALTNLVTLCRFHHRLIHEGGFGVRRTDDGTFVFRRPDGTPIEDARPPGRRRRFCGAGIFVSRRARSAARVSAETRRPRAAKTTTANGCWCARSRSPSPPSRK